MGGSPPLNLGSPLIFWVPCAPMGPNIGGGGGVPTPRGVPIWGADPHSIWGPLRPYGSQHWVNGGGGPKTQRSPNMGDSPPLNLGSPLIFRVPCIPMGPNTQEGPNMGGSPPLNLGSSLKSGVSCAPMGPNTGVAGGPNTQEGPNMGSSPPSYLGSSVPLWVPTPRRVPIWGAAPPQI